MRLHTIEQGSFHSGIDRSIAIGLFDAIERNATEGLIVPEIRSEALASLQALVSIVGEGGRRRIAGRPLSVAIERWITSRLDGSEVDIAGREGSWGRLPESVREEITARSHRAR